ncbi:MAG: type IV toxin-antitoxin system AbiEi family antitoxin [Porphyromonadaceae bacterium]|nr:type IV toxin-antitoxin system AbiEi family antitoxin [Porphyromonadaceae bacterium]
MSISDWVKNREIKGFPTFSYQEVCASFPSLSAQVVSNELYRLSKHKCIQSVHRGFYTVVPIQFKDRGIVPPYNYIGQLMAYLGKPYYISLLSAGVLHGAAHQRPQKLLIMTIPPRITFSKESNNQLFWGYRKEIPKSLLCETNSDTGIIVFSNAELTAVDLVQYNHLIGGLSVATTVINELVEKTNFEKYGDLLVKVTTLSALQRLGFLLDRVLKNGKQADAIYNLLYPHSKKLKYRPLTTNRSIEKAKRDPRWKIIINQEIEPDEW